ncbi:MAG: hypothetical protein JJT85_02825 [Chromatiales bacterium]|nr:hypothetical protein [Chromatiales bacterium]
MVRPLNAGELTPTDLERLFLAGELEFSPGGPVLRECLTGRVHPVDPGGDFPTLEAALEARDADRSAPLLVSLEGRIAATDPAGGPSVPRWLTVLRFVNAFPGESCPDPDRPPPRR